MSLEKTVSVEFKATGNMEDKLRIFNKLMAKNAQITTQAMMMAQQQWKVIQGDTGITGAIEQTRARMARRNKTAVVDGNAAMERAVAKTNRQFTQQITHMNDMKEKAGSLGKSIKANEGHFQAWALSIMFAGMAIMRVFQQIAKSGIKTFQDVQHSVEGTSTSFDVLNGHMKFLQYVAGAALEPLVEQLIPIIMATTDWIQENEKLFAGMVKWGLLIGGLLMVAGQAVLAIGGIVTMFKNMYSVGKWAFNGLGKLPGLVTKGWQTLTTELAAAKTIFKGLSTAGKLGFAGMVVGIILAIAWIWKLKEAMGGWKEFALNAVRGVVKAWDFLIAKKIQMKQFLIQLAWGDSVKEASRVAEDAYSRSIDQANMRREKMLGTPETGYADGVTGIVPTFNIANLNVTSDNVDEMYNQMNDMAQNGG